MMEIVPPGSEMPPPPEYYWDPNFDPNFMPEEWYDPGVYDFFNPFGDEFFDPLCPPPPPEYTGSFGVWVEFGDLPDNFDFPIQMEIECLHEREWDSGCTYSWSIIGATGAYIQGTGQLVTLVITENISSDVFQVKCVVTASNGEQGYGYLKVDRNNIPVYYYVSPSTGSDSNDGSSGAPFATIDKAVEEAQNITAELVAIWLEPTIYNITSTINLPPNTSIRTWTSYGSGTATLDGGGAAITLLSSSGAGNIDGFNPQNLILQNAATGISATNCQFLGNKLTIKNMTSYGVLYRNNGTYVTECEISECTFENFSSGKCISIGIEGSGGASSRVQAEIWNTTIQNNTTTDYLVYARIDNSTFLIEESTFSNNNNSQALLYRRGANAETEIHSSIFTNNGTTGRINQVLNISSGAPNSMLISKNRFDNNFVNNEMILVNNPEDISFENNLIFNNNGNTGSNPNPLIEITNSVDTHFLFNTLDDNFPGNGTLLDITVSNHADVVANAFTEGSPTTTALNVTGSSDIYDNYLFNVADGDIPIGSSGNFRDTQDQFSLYTNQPASDYTLKAGSVLIDRVGSSSVNLHEDYLDDPRPVDGDNNGTAKYDIGCYEKQDPLDPIISGTIYDSITGSPVSGSIIAIYPKDSQSVKDSTSGSTYRFNVDPGWYYLIVNKEGYYFPSTRKSQEVAGDHGDNFMVTGGVNQTINIPIDSTPYLQINKTLNKKKATAGEILTFNIEIANPYWFSDVPNVKLIDTIPGGLDYITGSTYLDNSKTSDPEITGKNLIFNIGTVGSNSSINISYQMVIPTGTSYGRYGSEALCRDSTNNNQISNIDSVSFEIVPDPLFSLGTVIGKVFLDENQNGIQDKGEKGVKDVIVSTEYGIEVITDANGMYHIPNVIKGRHILKIDPETLPEGYISPFSHGKLFEMTEGSHNKINFGLIPGEISQKKQYFIIALGEISLQQNEFSGNMEMVENDENFDDGFSIDGRSAFYLKGKIKGKYLIKASFDSARRSKEQKYFNQYRLFTNLDPEKYYPVYGDASIVNYDATETNNMLFVLVEWDESSARWGNIEVDMPSYRRVTSGAQIIYKSLDETKFGQKKLEAQMFYAIADHRSAHEEFIGTGSSVFLLGNDYVIEGSEKVKIEFRDRLTKSAIYSRELAEEIDYQIDYDSGRIILTRPLSSSYWNYKHTIISQDVTTGAQPVLIVDYEYETMNLLKQDSFGGRIDKTFGDHIKIGIQAIEEEREEDDYTLWGGDATITFNSTTSLTASYNESKETFQGGGVSYDGGVTITSQDHDFKKGDEGSSYSISGQTKIFKNKLNISASYVKTDPGYSALGSLTTQGTQQYTGTVKYYANESTQLGLTHVTTESLGEDEITRIVSTVNRSHTTNIYADAKKDKWDGRIEYQYQDVGEIFGGVKYLGNLPPRGEQIIAGRIGYQHNKDFRTYAILQSTIEGETNDQGTLGIMYSGLYNTDISLEGKYGTIGQAIGIHALIDRDSKEESFIGFQTGIYDKDERFQTVSFSKKYLMAENATMKISRDYSYFNESLLNGNVLESEVKINDLWGIGFSYEQNTVETNRYPESISREAASFRYSFIDPEVLNLSGRVEWREDENSSTDVTIRHLYFEDKLFYRFKDSLSFIFKGGIGYATNLQTDAKYFDFTELSTGFAFRPVDYDRLNLLGKYTFINDLPLATKNSFIETMKSRKHVFAFEGTYDLMPRIQLSGKLAYRMMSEKVGARGWQDSDTYLFLTGFLYEIIENWAVFSQYRILRNKTFDDQKQGFLCDVRRKIKDTFFVCIGYNFTKFDDDLTNSDEYDNHGFYLRIVGTY